MERGGGCKGLAALFLSFACGEVEREGPAAGRGKPMPVWAFATAAGLVISPPDPSWATFTIWTDAAIIENGPGICRGWEDANPCPYDLSSAASLTVTGPCVVWCFQDGIGSSKVVYGGGADFNCDGDLGTDTDIEAFFRCLSDGCRGADFNGDGDPGTDQDIECFFRVIGGGRC